MSGKYQKYPDYTDSHVKWLGSIPSHWPIFSGKRLFNNVRCPSLPSDEQLAASQKYGVIPQSIMMGLNDAKVMLALKGTESFRHVGKNNFVISLRSFEGGIEHSNYEGCVSPAYTVLESAKHIYAKYYKYLLKCGPYISALQSATDSLRDGKSITFEQFSAIALVFPEYDEQRQIANFLDHETAKIDTLIDKQQQLIKLLQEKRQAVISHAVTKGLNPDAVMKDSGVEWLGEVPEHWDVPALKYMCSLLKDGTHLPPPRVDDGIPLLSVRNLIDGKFVVRDDDSNISFADYIKLKESFEVLEGDVLLAVVGATLGKTAIVESMDCFHIQRSVAIFRSREKILHNKYLHLLFQSKQFSDLLWGNVGFSAQPGIYLGTLSDFRIPVPSIGEQEKIVESVEQKISKLEKLLSVAEKKNALLSERRTALISAAVTGKIDVRNWQPAQAEIPREASA
jgi:type I restriction enzyme S subunit